MTSSPADDFDGQVRAGDAARDARRWPAAVEAYGRAIKMRPSAAGIWVQYGHSLKESGDVRGAEAAYREAIRREPDNGDTHLQLGHVLKLQGRNAEAVSSYLTAQSLIPGSPDPARELAHFGQAALRGAQSAANQGALGQLVLEVRSLRKRLDAVEAFLPSIEALTAMSPDDYATFRETYRTPPPPYAGRSSLDVLIITSVATMNLRQTRAVCEGLRRQQHTRWRAVITGADGDCRALLRSFAALDPRITIDDGPDEEFYASARRVAQSFADHHFDWVVLIRPGFALAEIGLDWLITDHPPGVTLTYGDEHELWSSNEGPMTEWRSPIFRFGFDLDLAIQTDVVGGGMAVRSDVLATADFGECSDAAAFRMLPIHAANLGIVRHTPFMVASRLAPDLGEGSARADPSELAKRAASLTSCGNVVFAPDPFAPSAPPQMIRVPRSGNEPIEVVIPTKDRLDLLKPCVESLEARARGPIAITIVDNGTTDPDTLEWLASNGSRFTVLRVPQPFNWSQLNNLAAARSRATFLLFLNNDTVMLTEQWDERLRGQLERSNVGAVGTRLLYPDLTIQHAGFISGFGGFFVHEAVGAPVAERGDGGRLAHSRAVAAVTGACMAIERARFLDTGGFDERELMVACSDIDLCFRLRAAGLKIMYEPAITLIHHESKTRGFAHTSPANAEREVVERHLTTTRWAHALEADPALNPHWNRFGRPMSTIRAPSKAAVEAYMRLTGSANPWLLDPPRPDR